MQQALDYAVTLNIPLCSLPTATALFFMTAPAPAWRRRPHYRWMRSVARRTSGQKYRAWKRTQLRRGSDCLAGLFRCGSGKAPRYYQSNAINAAVEAIAKGPEPNSARHGHRHRQDLYRLSDYLAIVEGRPQETHSSFLPIATSWSIRPMVNDFRPFGAAMAKLSTGAKTIEREDRLRGRTHHRARQKRRIDTAYEVYLGLYQAITAAEERQKIYREFSPGFLI